MIAGGFLLCFVLNFVGRNAETHLPSFIVPCSVSDNLNNCVKKNANTALSMMLKGDKTFDVPNLNNYVLPKVIVSPNEDFFANFTDVLLTGLDTASVKDVKINLEENKWKFVVSLDHLKMSGTYSVKGDFLGEFLEAAGNGTVNLKKPVFTYKFQLQPENRDGIYYSGVISTSLTHQLEGICFNFENLTSKSGKTAKQMNELMNENWKEVDENFAPSLNFVVKRIVHSLLKSFFINIPTNELFH